ncbi:NADPH-dependent FMN reductase [Lysinibacillus sp. NPDC097195]|uniref:NADPH-dependent FMN reductase n=1 Tax=Lysinibacillus sp. NPDC097195 TaxID=3364141 RepID=UPI0037F477D8
MTKVVMINGSNTRYSRVTAIQEKIEHFLSAFSTTHIIHVHELPAVALITANFENDAIKAQNQKVEEADIVVILTPIYKASYTGILKTYLDLLPQKALVGKKVLPIAVGGSLGHLLALEYALKPVLAVLGATDIAHSVYIIDKQIIRLEDGSFAIEEEAMNRLEVELKNIQRIAAVN